MKNMICNIKMITDRIKHIRYNLFILKIFNINKFANNQLYKNSFFIYLGTLAYAAIGFFFWMLAARSYPAEDVGITSAIISSAGIISVLSWFGFASGLIRFLPGSANRQVLFNSLLLISLTGSLLFSSLFIIGIDIFSPSLEFLAEPYNALVFILYIISFNSNNFINWGFLALREAKYSFLQSIGQGLRIFLLIPLTFAGMMGIFGSIIISIIASVFIGIFLLYKLDIHLKPIISKEAVREVFKFSIANYANDFLLIMETSVLPLIALNMMGAKEAGYFYVAFSMATLLFAIPNSVFTSMFVEGSYGEPLKQTAMRSLILVLSIIIPCGIIMCLLGGDLLNLFGKDYSSNAYDTLRLLIISSFFVTINTMFVSFKRIQKSIKTLLAINIFLFVSILLSSYIFTKELGLIGVSLGWTIGQGLTAILIMIMTARNAVKRII